MIQAYIVTEGQSDADLLSKLLPETLTRDVVFVVGKGSYSAQSLAGSILASKQRPVALVLDAGTEDQQAVQEREDFLNSLLRRAASGIAFRVFLVRPMTEALLFTDRALFSEITGIDVSDEQWINAQHQPKQVIDEVLGGTDRLSELSFNSDSVARLRKHPLIDGLIAFLSSIVVEPT